MYSIEIEAITEITPKIIEQLVSLCDAIPEFERPYSRQVLESRLHNTHALLLIARIEGEVAGFKLGYQTCDNVFYSWLGGVIPDFRGLGLASSLLAFQENWASKKGYARIEVKTRNCFPAMLNMLIASQYQITAMTADAGHPSQNRLHLQKTV